jgi:hypothetical protein
LFGVAAGVLFALKADAVLASRWSMPALAVVHLLTLGFMLQAMTGALIQFLPVAVGVHVWHARQLGAFVHVGLALGTVALVGGFLSGNTLALRVAAVVLGLTIGVFAFAATAGLATSRAIGPTLPALRWALAALVVTMSLGVALVGTFAGWWSVSLLPLTATHAAVGLIGWSLTLVVGVSYVVVPMFQLTPGYPSSFAFNVPRALAAALALWAVGVLFDVTIAWLATFIAGGAMTAYATATVWLQIQRRRAVVDASFWAWRGGMLGLVLAAVLGVGAQAAPPSGLRDGLELALGLTLIAGVFPVVITGMIYKIIPFLVWLHLQQRLSNSVPMQHVIPQRSAGRQLGLFAVAFALLLAGVLWHPLAPVGGALFAISCAWLEWNIVAGARASWQNRGSH